ncbi:thioredoxin [Meinhardsimonia xiamenensis]|uniref:Thioredoxin n=1 Tax=Meinhardsimonia xiamenensis TaxID=990712 RepID=A0A1G8YEB7_9RHOB|nr:thioredoxin TrxC [Meinhardsimonia xiamenensis]PRX37273.1 thioredoxin [Meinhardsimonia xiamenensis]SDK01222.1 thioredoxin [Meinhardsimonia xiamenensis]
MAATKLTCLECGQANRVPATRLDDGPKCGTCGAALVDGKVHDIDLETLQKAAKLDGMPLVVDFWAPWCGPCRMMAPAYAQAAASLKGRARFAKLNTEAHPQAGMRYNIRGIPTLVIFQNGRETARQSGAMPAQMIERWITEHIRPVKAS